ncbi:MAG: hypothetical protein FJZ58_07870, partial [Chlamydiae bacterium]|nr:hypothetical protein [Chlamydiota bacterium]
MNFEAFRRATPQEFFDYSWIAEALKDLKKPRDCISALIADHKILRLKRGLYVFGELWRRAPLYEEMLANLLYGPSCVSFEYALAQYGMIAERPSVITSLTIGDSKTFHTPLGIFEYRAITSKKFKVGIEYKDLGDMGGYFIASKEKALADLVYRTSRIRNIEQLRHYLFEEMRIDESAFQALDKKKL